MKQIKKILVLGSGALKIGEAGEFDYSGTQAIKAFKEEGKEVVLVNPNIATIQTSTGYADRVYFLPVTQEFVSRVIEQEKPDAITISFGGQTALNCGIDLYKRGLLKKFGVTLLGSPIEAVIDTEDRKLFAAKLASIGLKTAVGKTITSIKEGEAFARKNGFPVMLRTGFALGGTGSGIIRTKTELTTRVGAALKVFPQLILEECLYGWKEIEYEVVRDRDDNCITVCNMENFDPTGIHTGESIVVAPSQTLTNTEYFQLRDLSIRAIRSFGIVGECNIQYALNPASSDYRIIEVNARLSRSSALASKATGYPLAYIAAKLALGKRLWELPNSVTKKTTAFFEPALDYVVVKIPRWDLEKFTHADSVIGSEMKSVGEVMSIARTFEEAIQQGARMLNDGYGGVIDTEFIHESKSVLLDRLKQPTTQRLFTICSALYVGVDIETLFALTQIDRWFLEKLARIVAGFKELQQAPTLTQKLLGNAKRLGFSDKQIATARESTETKIREQRLRFKIVPQVKRVDTLAGEFPAVTNYMYLTYQATTSDHEPNRHEKKALVVGSGPYAIGTSVEFDWCAVNAVSALKKQGFKGVMINCNPETVSTDYDHSDYLYFTELTLERMLDIYALESSPFVLSVGGQIPNNLSQKLAPLGIPIIGPTAGTIARAENRESFSKLLDKLTIAQPAWDRAYTTKQAQTMAHTYGYPVLLRPSFVLSGKAMRVIETDADLIAYMNSLTLDLKEHPLLITKFLKDAQECDFDGVAYKGTIVISALSEHIEAAGVHSGDSSLMFPAVSIAAHLAAAVEKASAQIVAALNLTGPFNIQFLLTNFDVFVIECNIRASRSFPFVSKVMRQNFIEIATDVALDQIVPPKKIRYPHTYVGVKVPQFSYRKLKGADPVQTVEMNSTGEVAALGENAQIAYMTALMATGVKYPTNKAVFISLGGMKSKLDFLSATSRLARAGFTIYATSGTAFFLKDREIPATQVGKLYEGTTMHVGTLIRNRKIDFAVVIPETYSDNVSAVRVKKGLSDGYKIRRAAIDFDIPIFSNTQSARYFVDALTSYTPQQISIKSLQTYQEEL